MLAAAVGGVLGWYLRSIVANRHQSGLEKLWLSRIQLRDQELEARRVTTRIYAAKASALASELAGKNALLAARESQLAAMAPTRPSRPLAAPEVEVPVRRGDERIGRETRDDLQRILGIGPALARKLYAQGVTTFKQIAQWTDADLELLAEQVDAHPHRIKRESWREHARREHELKYGERL
jgi:predicted flap endonuclease-1-like 5' DNA nuclease